MAAPHDPRPRPRRTPGTAAGAPSSPAASATVPGRTAAFIWAVIALVCCTVPLLCVPLGILALVFAIRAFRHTTAGRPGRGLVIAALVISGAALAITITLALLAAAKFCSPGMFGLSARRSKRAAEAEATRLSGLAQQLHWRTGAVRDAIVQRRLSYFLGVVMSIFGLGYLSLGVLPAIRVGWDLSAQIRAGRGNGFTPLGFVLVATSVIACLLIFAGVGSVISAVGRVSQTRDQLVRFRIENEAELPAIEVLRAQLVTKEEALTARVREERARQKRDNMPRS